jgi:hypothetical protein
MQQAKLLSLCEILVRDFDVIIFIKKCLYKLPCDYTRIIYLQILICETSSICFTVYLISLSTLLDILELTRYFFHYVL